MVTVRVRKHERGLHFRHGDFVGVLGPGTYRLWGNLARPGRETVEVVSTLETEFEHPLLESIVRDPSLRAELAVAEGTRTLDALLADKESVGGEVRQSLSARAREFGVEVRSVGLKDIILPGDMKVILNQVIEAQKRAEAELIRRREETAAARSQANTARLLAENPVLARLRELELLQQTLAGAKATFVFGPGNIADQVRALAARPDGQ